MWGLEDKNYLDHKAMYNEISLTRSRARSQLNRVNTVANQAIPLLQNTDKQAIVEATKQAMNRAMSTTNYKDRKEVEKD